MDAPFTLDAIMTTRLSFGRLEFLLSWTFLVNKMSLWIGSDPFAEFESMRPLKKDAEWKNGWWYRQAKTVKAIVWKRRISTGRVTACP